jgi:hypothetical protein
MEKHEYCARVKGALEKLHGCRADYHETVPVLVALGDKTLWQGEVEVFLLTGHPRAVRAYAWSEAEDPGDFEEGFVAVLEIPPVDSAKAAVRNQLKIRSCVC